MTIDMSSPLYLVDGSGYIFRAYYAIAPLSNQEGMPTNALFGFARMLIKLLRDIEARHIAVTFDTGAPTFRHQRYAEYKANRGKCPEDLVPQMPFFRDIARAFGTTVLEQPGFEADDIIGTIAKKLAGPAQKVVIVSGDKDLAQLVNDNVEVWDAMRDIHYDAEAVRKKFGVEPSQLIDYFALTGDASDNVPGIKGIGDKTAQTLIANFGSLDALLENPEKIEEIQDLRGKAGVRKKVECGVDAARLSKELVTLDTEVSPFNKVASVEEFRWTEPDTKLLVPLFEKLSFEKLSGEIPSPSGNGVVLPFQPAKKKENDYSVVSQSSLFSLAESLSKLEAFAFDTETTSLDVMSCSLVGISIAWEDRKAFYIPISGEAEPERHIPLEYVRKILGPVFENPSIKKVGLNLKYDTGVLEQHGFTVNGLSFDAMLASYVLNPDKRQHGLKALAQLHLNEQMQTYEMIVGDKPNIGCVPIDDVCRYACHDADASWRLMAVLNAKLGEESEAKLGSLRYVFKQIEMPLVAVLSQMERAGIKIDKDYLSSLAVEFKADLDQIEREIHADAGVVFNINSPKQLGQILFEEMAISTTGVKKTKTGFSTDVSVLSKLAGQYPIVEKILEYREIAKLLGTYVEALANLVNEDTGRLHASFNQAIAATGRLSSSNPNVQNIPIRTERGRRIREAFIAEDGHQLISVDYSQIELRVLAHIANDECLIEAFNQGEDIHASTARQIFGEAALDDREMSSLRRVAKTINFGIIYGMSAFRLSSQLGVSRKQAQQYIDDYFSRYAGVRSYFDKLAVQAEKDGFVETMFGRRRYLQDIDTAGRDAGYVLRSVLNAPIQGSAAEIIKLAMIKLFETMRPFGDKTSMVLQVHDELVFEVSDDIVDQAQQMIVQGMEQAVELKVPLRVDSRVGRTWGGET